MLYTIAVMSLIGSLGATAFTMMIMVMSLSFLCDKDFEKIRYGMNRYGYFLIILAAYMISISYTSYRGDKPWYEFLIFQSTSLTMAFWVLCLFLNGIPKFRIPSLLPKNKILKAALFVFIIAGIINGLSPYFGWKYRLSFAMLSNLRVDQTRWNHLFIPSSMSIRKYDPFIKVTGVFMDYKGTSALSALKKNYSKRGIYPGLFSPMSFKHRIKIFKQENAKVYIRLIYQGKTYKFADAVNNNQLYAFLKNIPDSKMFQEWLSVEGPQRCFH